MYYQLITEFFWMKICLILKIHFNTQTGNQFWTMMTLINLMNNSKTSFLSLFNDHFPLQTKDIYNKADRKPWITPGILTSICAKRRLEKKREVTQTNISPSIEGIKTSSPKLLVLSVSNIIVPC